MVACIGRVASRIAQPAKRCGRRPEALARFVDSGDRVAADDEAVAPAEGRGTASEVDVAGAAGAAPAAGSVRSSWGAAGAGDRRWALTLAHDALAEFAGVGQWGRSPLSLDGRNQDIAHQNSARPGEVPRLPPRPPRIPGRLGAVPALVADFQRN